MDFPINKKWNIIFYFIIPILAQFFAIVILIYNSFSFVLGKYFIGYGMINSLNDSFIFLSFIILPKLILGNLGFLILRLIRLDHSIMELLFYWINHFILVICIIYSIHDVAYAFHMQDGGTWLFLEEITSIVPNTQIVFFPLSMIVITIIFHKIFI